MNAVCTIFALFILILTNRGKAVHADNANDQLIVNKCDNNRGTCKHISNCPDILSIYHLIYNKVKFCDEANDVVCCPNPIAPRPVLDTRLKFERECKRYSDIRGQCPTTPFIVNGIKAEAREFPFMALIGLDDATTKKIEWKCGGTLISPKYVLTAAHCLVTSIEKPKYIVRLGELDHAILTDETQTQDFHVVNSVLHPGYDDNEEQNNDIAVVELDKDATFNEYVMPACLPSSDGNEFSQFTAAGWGQTSESGPSSSHLLKVSLNRFDDQRCEHMLEDNQINVRTQICAGSFNSSSDTCQGDSGGPIFVTHPVLRCLKQVIGVTSFGSICGSQNMPSVYTRVNLYTDWIEKIVWQTM